MYTYNHVIINDLRELSCLMEKNTEQSGEEMAIYFPRITNSLSSRFHWNLDESFQSRYLDFKKPRCDVMLEGIFHDDIHNNATRLPIGTYKNTAVGSLD